MPSPDHMSLSPYPEKINCLEWLITHQQNLENFGWIFKSLNNLKVGDQVVQALISGEI